MRIRRMEYLFLALQIGLGDGPLYEMGHLPPCTVPKHFPTFALAGGKTHSSP